MNTKIKAKSRASVSGLAAAAVIVVSAAAWFSVRVTIAEETDVVVYKTPYCGCCVKWVAHLREYGFDVSVVNVPNTIPVQERVGVPRNLGTCHTVVLGDYWVEGHVPADLIEQLLTEKPDDILGIAVPGMPMGSPGMAGQNPVEYQIVAYGSDGRTTVYATRQGQSSVE